MTTAVEHPVVQTRAGAVRGSVVDGGIHVFKGMPYAAPPFGANRLRPPQPVTPWSGVRDALTFGPKQPQLPYPPDISALLPELVGSGEDCLNLNVWSPELRPAGHPVMVWIPGSQFEFGTAATAYYDGSRFARDGIVCVTLNYRVAVDGFLYLGDGIANLGLLDQVAALEWVRENIAAFGGDPQQVTIFGESAGAMCIATLLSMPRAEGLFRRAIVESGTAHQVVSAATAQRIAGYLADKLGVAATREAIAAVPVDRVLAAQAELIGDLVTHPDPQRWGEDVVASPMLWQPVVDGVIIPARPIERIAAGAGAGVDLMVGTNTDESRLFRVVEGSIERITDEALTGAVADYGFWALAAYGLPVESILSAYRAAHPAASPGDLLAAIQTDWGWRIPALRLADAHAQHGPNTYMYEFAWRTPALGGRLGACHVLEVPFVFDTLGYQTEPLLGANPPQPLAERMHAAWVAFATTGDPGWPKYELSRRATMRFDTTSAVVDDPLFRERALWEGVR